MMKESSKWIAAFVEIIIENGDWTETDRYYLTNRIAKLVGCDFFEQPEAVACEQEPLRVVEHLLNIAQANRQIDDSITEAEQLEAELMDFITPTPTTINRKFMDYYQESPRKATDYFYQLCKTNNYIKTKAIAKNIIFPMDSPYGKLEITINLSKPEKDARKILAEKKMSQKKYPACMLCMENEGYYGRVNYPARTNHRIIRLNLEDEAWGFQYSPYAYYNEHAIFLDQQHREMKIEKKTFQRLLKITELFPEYFVGSNADLPIVGGSILSHDHYQAGRHTFPMDLAPMEKRFSLKKYPEITAGILKWPMSVIRLQSDRQEELVEAAELILTKWRNYSDERVSVRAYSEDGTPHHTITPIARRKGSLFELDLVLRDNNVSEEFPDGIFHPHPEVQHIKKENIGLIEVMGLAILPPRLAQELREVEKYLLKQPNQIAESHRDWADELSQQTITEANVKEVIQQGIGTIFVQILTDAGVFKRDEEGRRAFERFIQCIEND